MNIIGGANRILHPSRSDGQKCLSGKCPQQWSTYRKLRRSNRVGRRKRRGRRHKLKARSREIAITRCAINEKQSDWNSQSFLHIPTVTYTSKSGLKLWNKLSAAAFINLQLKVNWKEHKAEELWDSSLHSMRRIYGFVRFILKFWKKKKTCRIRKTLNSQPCISLIRNNVWGEFLDIISRDPRVTKFNRLHVDIFRFFLIDLRYIR